MRNTLGPARLSALLALGLLASAGSAHAGRFGGHGGHGGYGGGGRGAPPVAGGGVRVSGGGVHVSGGVRVSGGGVRVSGGVQVVPPRWTVGGTIRVGGYAGPRPYYYYGPGYVPSYYGGYGGYYPVAPAAGPGVYAAAAPQEPLPRLGVGLFAGAVNNGNQQAGDDVGVLGRLRLTDGLLIEGELGKTELAGGVRVDRRLAGSLVYELGARSALAPFVLAGTGVNQADVGGNDWTTTQSFVEVGAGLRYALSRNVHVSVEIRGGSRQASETPVSGLSGAARTVAPTMDQGESYTRGRAGVVLYF